MLQKHHNLCFQISYLELSHIEFRETSGYFVSDFSYRNTKGSQSGIIILLKGLQMILGTETLKDHSQVHMNAVLRQLQAFCIFAA